MKKSIFFVLLATLLTCSSAFAQSGSTQTNPTPKNLSYNFIMEFGNYLGNNTFGFTGVAINSLSLKDRNLIGIGVGYEANISNDYYYDVSNYYTIDNETIIPIFFNFRHYFDRPEKTVKPLVNFAVGTRLCFTELSNYVETYDPLTGYYSGYTSYLTKFTPGFYATMTAGFKAKAFSFTSGFFCKSDYNGFSSGIEVKMGLTF
jgi:hypothetical protein